jgi:hypothetical protein
LEVGSLDAVLVCTPDRNPAAHCAKVDAPGSHLVENCLLELDLDLDALPRTDELVVLTDRPDDRGQAGCTIEPLEPQTVRQQVRDRGLQDVESRQRILTNPDQNVNSEPWAPDEVSELLGEAPTAPVVEEAFLELIEDEIEIAAGSICSIGERVDERISRSADRLDERRHRVSRPGREDDDLDISLFPQAMCDPGAQH